MFICIHFGKWGVIKTQKLVGVVEVGVFWTKKRVLSLAGLLHLKGNMS
jgi:hypothetical protein